MIDERQVFERVMSGFVPPDDSLERLVHRRDRKRRNQRIAAGVVGIAVFVAAVWIVTSVGSLDRGEKVVVPAESGTTGPAETRPAETGPAETALAPPLASAAPDVVSEERCRNRAPTPGLDEPRSRMELTDMGDRIKVRFEVYQSPLGQFWRIVLRHLRGVPNDSRDSLVFFRGTRVAAEDGQVVVQRRVWDTIRLDPVEAKAVDTQTGQVCRVDATIG